MSHDSGQISWLCLPASSHIIVPDTDYVKPEPENGKFDDFNLKGGWDKIKAQAANSEIEETQADILFWALHVLSKLESKAYTVPVVLIVKFSASCVY